MKFQAETKNELLGENQKWFKQEMWHLWTIALESLSNKVAALKASSFIKKRLQHRYFPVNIAEFLRTPISKNICERLLLIISSSSWKSISDKCLTCSVLKEAFKRSTVIAKLSEKFAYYYHVIIVQ